MFYLPHFLVKRFFQSVRPPFFRLFYPRPSLATSSSFYPSKEKRHNRVENFLILYIIYVCIYYIYRRETSAAARSDDSNSPEEREKETGWNINYLRRRAGSLQKMSKERNSSLYIYTHIQAALCCLCMCVHCSLLLPFFVTGWWLVYCFFSLGNDGTSSSIPKSLNKTKKTHKKYIKIKKKM